MQGLCVLWQLCGKKDRSLTPEVGTKKSSYIQGIWDAFPIIMGFIPIGTAYGVVAQQAGMGIGKTLLMSLIVFAGASQFIGVSLMSAGAGFIEVVLTTFVVNLRHVLMTASLSPFLKDVSRRFIPVLSFQVTDETYALSISKFAGKGGDPGYLLGLNNAAYAAWFLGSLTGALLGSYVPAVMNHSLSFALPAMFIGLLFLQVKKAGELWVVGSAAIFSTAFYFTLSRTWSIILAAILASVIGMLVERWTEES